MKVEHGKPRTDGNAGGYYFLYRIARRCWAVLQHDSQDRIIGPSRDHFRRYYARTESDLVKEAGRDLETFRLRRDAEHYLEYLDRIGE